LSLQIKSQLLPEIAKYGYSFSAFSFVLKPEKNRGRISEPMSLSQEQFRRAMSCFATGVTVITVDHEGEVKGMTANAFASVSLDPLLVLVCVDQKASTHAHLHARRRFGVNVLAEEQRALSEHYARSDRELARVGQELGARFDRTAHGTPVLQGALAYLECRLHHAQDAGDHTIFIAEVEDLVIRPGKPLIYFQSAYFALGPKLS
jgi:flavin reductase (DIM6/NTAB) family NADH-FMN oxidoreductase RutF